MTVRRDWLMKKILAGGVIGKCDSYLTDGYAWMPVRVKQFGEYSPSNTLGLFSTDFKTKSGGAHREESGHVSLIVHSNRSFIFCVEPGKCAEAHNTGN